MEKFIACGMYAFTEAQQRAWQELFNRFETPLESCPGPRREIDFRHGDIVLRDPALCFGHTCGYPLMTHLRGAFTPFCTARFDVPGTDGKYYASQIIVHADSAIGALSECKGMIAAVNNRDSNSGMNAFRYELSRINAQPGFFDEVLMSGGHLNSLEAVAEKRADVAAIDCVTFQLIVDAYPSLADQVRSIGLSAKTCGLPFVFPGTDIPAEQKSRYTDALQQACDQLSPESRQCLHLAGFEAVDLDDYNSILELERYALERGFDLLN
jgi:ABC-type phosphate/phosphonate transport system substrate-binding protein